MEFYEILERAIRHSLSEQACVSRVLGAVFLRFFICLSLFYLELHLPTQWQKGNSREWVVSSPALRLMNLPQRIQHLSSMPNLSPHPMASPAISLMSQQPLMVFLGRVLLVKAPYTTAATPQILGSTLAAFLGVQTSHQALAIPRGAATDRTVVVARKAAW
jgi:hypothetical protein